MSQTRSSTGHGTGNLLPLALVSIAVMAWWLTSLTMSESMSSTGTGDMTGDVAGDMAGMPGTDGDMTTMSLGAFLLSWTLMMAAMMLPAVTPVVRLYQRAAAAGRVAPTAYFVTAYLAVWALTGLPAYLAWRAMAPPLADGESWALRLAGAMLLLAGAYQLTPLKRACLRHCRSPMSYFMRLHGSLDRPSGALRAGVQHAAYCCGCCVGLMVVLVAAAAMNLGWALLIAVGVFIERNLRSGAAFSLVLGAALVLLGAAVVWHPPVLSQLI